MTALLKLKIKISAHYQSNLHSTCNTFIMTPWYLLISSNNPFWNSLRLQENIPFAVVGTDKEHQVNGNKVLGRKTKWGIIEGKPSFLLYICRTYDWIYTKKSLNWCTKMYPMDFIIYWNQLIKSQCKGLQSGVRHAALLCKNMFFFLDFLFLFHFYSCCEFSFFSVENVEHCEFAYLRDLVIRWVWM